MRVLTFFLLIGISLQLCAEPPAKTPELTNILRPMARSSGVIFSGSVVKIDRTGPDLGNGITRITFRVEQAIRGVRRGELLQVSEWGGLWNAGERYRNGEHVLLFLYPQSKLGLTSPVAGAQGRFAMDGPTRVLLRSPVDRHTKPIEVREFVAAIRRAGRE